MYNVVSDGLGWSIKMVPRRGLEPHLKYQILINKTIPYDSDIYLRSTHVPRLCRRVPVPGLSECRLQRIAVSR